MRSQAHESVNHAENAPERASIRDNRALSKPAYRSPSRSTAKALRRFFLYWLCVGVIWGLISLAAIVTYYAARLPPLDKLVLPRRPPNISILAQDGQWLLNRGSTGGQVILLSDLPAYVPQAFLAIEDRRFYHHFGLDMFGLARALLRNLIEGHWIQGGSTLTQQLAKNLFLTSERSFDRKIQEAILALWLEYTYSKAQILELYLNRTYFGAGAYGIEAAAQRYFGKKAQELSLKEASVLAGLMKAPSRYAPNRSPQLAETRSRYVLLAMVQENYITPEIAQAARVQNLRMTEGGSDSIHYAADYIVDMLEEIVGEITEDIVVTSTLRRSFQEAAASSLNYVLDKKGQNYHVSQGALVAMDPQTGAIRALIGGRDYRKSQFNRAVSAKRQPGSAFKPFVFLTALEKGLTPESVKEDGPINLKGWKPENFDKRFRGPVTLTEGLAFSLNGLSVRLILEVNPQNVILTAHRLGIVSPLEPNASLALGTEEVTPLELVSAYCPFANGGMRIQPHIIAQIRTEKGRILYQRRAAPLGSIIAPAYVAMMNRMMSQTLTRGTGRKAYLKDWQAAGKTGTTQDFRDAWFVGYTAHLVAGIWIGNDDNTPTKNNSGSNLPPEVWKNFMIQAHKTLPHLALPYGLWMPPELESLVQNAVPL